MSYVTNLALWLQYFNKLTYLLTYLDRMSIRLLLMTYRNSYTVFRLVQTAVILNDTEGRNSPYFALFYRIR